MNMHRVWHSLFAGAVVAALFSPAAEAALLYRETFGRPGPPAATGNLAVHTGWDWIRFNVSGSVNTGNGVNGTDDGAPTNVANTASAGPNNDATTGAYARGWVFMDGSTTAGQKLAMTTEHSVDPSLYVPGSLTFSWWQGNNYTNSDGSPGAAGLNAMKVAVRVGGQWYASNAVFLNTDVTGGSLFPTGAQLQTMTFDPAAANWTVLNFDGNYDPSTDAGTASTVALTLGGPAGANLAGPITAFGLYRDIIGRNARFDSFTIEGTPIPEPATLALAALGMAGALASLRRRSH
jgi:hypothetical protein